MGRNEKTVMRRFAIFEGALLVVALCLESWPSRAGKDDKEKEDKEEKEGSAKDARKHFEKGVDLFEKEDYSEALEEFKKSFEIKRHWSVRYNLGMCYIALGSLAEGVTELSMFLEEGGKNVKSSMAKEVNAALIDLLPELGTIVIFGDLKDYTFQINGKPVQGPTEKGELFIQTGTFDFSILKDDKIVVERSLSVEKGEIIEMDIKEEAAKAAKAQPPDKPVDPGVPKPVKPDNPGTKIETKTGAPGEKTQPMVKRLWLWVALGITGATLATGTAMGILAVKERDAMRSDEDRYRLLEGTATPAELAAVLKRRNDHYDKGQAFALSSTVLLSVGAAGAVASIVLLVLTERKVKPREKKAKTSLFFSPQLQGGTLTWVF
jgi:tetratricopeptide (TPR) repeat protein